MKELSKKYILCNEREIKKFLEKNPNLIPIILLVADNVGKYFDFFYLTLSYIKFNEEEWLEVEIVMKREISVDRGLEQLDKFDDEFLLEIKEDISQIIIDIKFI